MATTILVAALAASGVNAWTGRGVTTDMAIIAIALWSFCIMVTSGLWHVTGYTPNWWP